MSASAIPPTASASSTLLHSTETFVSHGGLPVPQIQRNFSSTDLAARSSSSPDLVCSPSPTVLQSDRHPSNTCLNMTYSGPLAPTTSFETRFRASPPPGTNNPDTGTTLDGYSGLVAEHEWSSTLGRKHGAVWLAPSPISFFAGMRYSRRDKLDYTRENVIEVVPPGNEIGFRPETLGRLGWRPYEHPEGSVYFRAENFYTNLWLYDEADLEAIERVVSKLREALAERPQFLSRDIEFCIDLVDDDEEDSKPGDKLGCYCVVDKAKEEAFFLHEVPSGLFCDGADMKIISREHLGYGARMGYWYHVYMFPHGRRLLSETVANLRATVSYQKFDKETSKSSTSPYSSEDAQNFLQALKEIEHCSPDIDVRPEHMVIIARMRSTLYRENFIRFRGERYAQLDCDKSIFEQPPQSHSKTFRTLSWFFLFTTYVYHERLSRALVDDKVNPEEWETLIRKDLPWDWESSIMPSTIVLSANVRFLAIQSVDQGGVTAADRTMGQIVSYLSTLLSIGNIAASTILAWQHRRSAYGRPENAAEYLYERASSRGRLEKLAVIFSIPATLFLWGLLTFFIAIFWLCVHGASAATRISASFVTGINILLLVAIMSNNDWRSLPQLRSLENKMKRMRKLVKRAPVTVVAGWKSFSKLVSKRATAFAPRQRALRYPHVSALNTVETQPASSTIEL